MLQSFSLISIKLTKLKLNLTQTNYNLRYKSCEAHFVGHFSLQWVVKIISPAIFHDKKKTNTFPNSLANVSIQPLHS